MKAGRAERLVAVAVLAAGITGGAALCQEPPGAAAQGDPEGSAAAWDFYASAYGYFVPDDHDYLVPIVYADRDRLHLEARYNYEAADTGSIFAGWNFGTGETVVFEATAMLAAIFGDLEGVAPAYRFTIEYKKLEVYSEGEYVFDREGDEGDFFYNWSEVSYRPVEWFRAGLVGQRTRLYETSLDIQRGFLVGFTHKAFDGTLYVMNLDQDDPTIVLAAGVEF